MRSRGDSDPVKVRALSSCSWILNEVETDPEPVWSETLRPGGRGHSTEGHSGRGNNLCKNLLEKRALCIPEMSSSPCGWKGQGGRGKDSGRHGQGTRHAGPSTLAQEIDSSCRRWEARDSGQQRGSVVSPFESASELRQGAVGRSGLRPTAADP